MDNTVEDLPKDSIPLKNGETVTEVRSKAAKKMWDTRRGGNSAIGFDKKAAKYDYKCFEGLHLSKLQKAYIVTYLDPPYLGRKEFRYEAYKKVYNPSNQNSLKANCSSLLNKTKIKEGIRLYRIHALKNHKQEVTNESIENLRKRSTYSVSTFYFDDGEPKPLDEIPEEWMICVDNIEIDKKITNNKEARTVKYKLCDRDKALDRLQKLLGVSEDIKTIEIPMPGTGQNAIESAEGTNNRPQVLLQMSIGHRSDE